MLSEANRGALGSIEPEVRGDLLQPGKLAAVGGNDRAQTGHSAGRRRLVQQPGAEVSGG